MEKPLAIKLAPASLKEVLGQEHLIGKNKILTNLVNNKKIFSMILYGQPGIGKTSIANAIINDLGIKSRFLNATIHSKKDFDIVFEEAKMYDGLILVVDEIHRLNKDKQDLLLPCVESGLITLIGLTTSNPYHKINPAIRSRCQLFELKPLEEKDIIKGLNKAIKTTYLENIKISKETIKYIAILANNDLRYAYNLLEICYYSNKDHEINIDIVNNISNKKNFLFDKNEDTHYDLLSALQKSIRGSDTDAAIHYLARLIYGGDLDSIYRRLRVIAYEDIGLANPSIGPKIDAAISSCEVIGMPECIMPLSVVVIEMCLSPKSNSAYLAISKALSDLETKGLGNIPNHLKSPYTGYKYPHNYQNSYVKQQYLPDKLKDVIYYAPKKTSQYEKMLADIYEKIKKLNQ